jgi:hypothetical protein
MSPSLILPRADALKLDSGKMYFITNNTLRPLTTPDGRTPLLRYAKIPYPLGPGEKEIVPFDLIALYFGDPRSRNGMVQKFKDSKGSGMIQSREAELSRIAVLWGVYEQGVDSLAQVVPDITVATLNGQEVVPPCFDPWGEFTYGFEKGPVDTQSGAAAQIAAMQDQMDQLKAQMEAMMAGGDNDADVPEDLPANHPAFGGLMAPATP